MSRRVAIIQGHPDALGGHFVLKFCGVRPVRETFIGMLGENDHARMRWLERLRALGREGR